MARRIILSGNLTRDLELKYTQSGTAVLNGNIAVNLKYGEKEKVSFVNFTVFGKYGEVLHGFNKKKGDPLYIEGRAQIDKWEKDGKNYKKLNVIVDEYETTASGGTNIFIVTGNLVETPEIKTINGDTKVVNGSIAINYKLNKGNEYVQVTDFYQYSAFNKTAEFMANYMTKGTKVLLEGALLVSSYENKDGDNVPTFTIDVNTARFMSQKNDNENVEKNDTEENPATDDIDEDIDELDEDIDIDEDLDDI